MKLGYYILLIIYTPSITASNDNTKLSISLTNSTITNSLIDTGFTSILNREKRFTPNCDSVLGRLALKGCQLDISQIISGDSEILLTLNDSVALFYNNLNIERKIDYLNYHFIEKVSKLLKIDSSEILSNYSKLLSDITREENITLSYEVFIGELQKKLAARPMYMEHVFNRDILFYFIIYSVLASTICLVLMIIFLCKNCQLTTLPPPYTISERQYPLLPTAPAHTVQRQREMSF